MTRVSFLFKIQQLIQYKKFEVFFEMNRTNLLDKDLKKKFYEFMEFHPEENISLFTQFLEYLFYNWLLHGKDKL